MVNYKRVVCEVAVLALLATASVAAPTDCREKDTHYDQRQNGSENYRLNIDGIVIAVAPAEALTAAAADFDFNLLDIDFGDLPKPPSQKPPKPVIEPKPEEFKPDEVKPEDVKPDGVKPEEAAKPEAPLSDVSLSDAQSQKKDASSSKPAKGHRLKNRLANFLMPLLRRTRHH